MTGDAISFEPAEPEPVTVPEPEPEAKPATPDTPQRLQLRPSKYQPYRLGK